MRTFIATDIPEDVKELLKNAIDKLKNIYENVKWVDFKNIHLTLTFLGEIDNQKVMLLADALEKILANEKSFNIYIGNITGFPSKQHARVICFEIIDQEKRIKQLKSKIDNEIKRMGLVFQDNREYIPHLTLGRVRGDPVKLKVYSEYQNKLFELREISIYESILTKDGPIYNKVKNYTLKK